MRRGCPIRISLDQNLLAVPQSFSQRATSFIASWCQGIHRMPFCRSIFCSPKGATHITAKLERDSAAYPPCTGTIHRNHVTIIAFILKLTARNGRFQNNPDKNPKKLHPVPARNSCNIHGHHNRNHCIIIHLNTRNFRNYSSWLTPLPRSDNPLQKIRTKMPKTLSHPQQFSTRIQTHQNLFTV